MKNIIINLAFFSALFLGCKAPKRNEPTKPETPKALQEGSSKDFGSFSKRGYDREDLVESLYSGLADTTTELKDIEKQINYLYNAKTDSLDGFINFNQKNSSYYSSADQHVKQIMDSILRERLILVLNNSQTKYNSQIKKHNDLITVLDEKNLSLEDLHTVLKIIKTLPLIEKYQRDNIPNTNSINNVIKQLDKTTRQIDTLAKQ